jgi:hypothetical protein
LTAASTFDQVTRKPLIEFIGVIRFGIDTLAENPRYINGQNSLEMARYPAIFQCMGGDLRPIIGLYSGSPFLAEA